MIAMWIQEYREANGMELDDFARAVNRYGHTKMIPRMICTITDTLIHMLERDKNCVTHPIIANAIAEYCGATPEQRDMIVAPAHKGNWEPRKRAAYAKQCEVRFNNCQNGARPVVKVDRHGNVVAAYESVTEAARREQMNEDNIRKRCKRRIKQDITLDMPYTYRYQEEWKDMNREEQLRDILSNGEILG